MHRWSSVGPGSSRSPDGPGWRSGSALSLWFLGSAAWSLAYGGRPAAPYPTFADVPWLPWYPLTAVGIFSLIRVRVPQFELHRWMDGIAVTLR